LSAASREEDDHGLAERLGSRCRRRVEAKGVESGHQLGLLGGGIISTVRARTGRCHLCPKLQCTEEAEQGVSMSSRGARHCPQPLDRPGGR
jgi:hypothetical protein